MHLSARLGSCYLKLALLLQVCLERSVLSTDSEDRSLSGSPASLHVASPQGDHIFHCPCVPNCRVGPSRILREKEALGPKHLSTQLFAKLGRLPPVCVWSEVPSA